MMPAYPKHMSDIYKRLRSIGFQRKYVQNHFLPEWWEDSLASDSSNRRLAEISIAKSLKIPLRQISDQNCELELPAPIVKFTKWDNVSNTELWPSVVVAKRISELVVGAAIDLPPYSFTGIAAENIRHEILETNEHVDLNDLVLLAWKHGIPILYIDSLPEGARRTDGMILHVGSRPVIVLASKRKKPSWLLWHLAHELGHASLGHINASDYLDIDITASTEDAKEQEANHYAGVLIFGERYQHGIKFQNMAAENLASEAQSVGKKCQIYPPSLVLIYGFYTRHWGTAEMALSILGEQNDGSEIILENLLNKIDIDMLSENEKRLLFSVGTTIQ